MLRVQLHQGGQTITPKVRDVACRHGGGRPHLLGDLSPPGVATLTLRNHEKEYNPFTIVNGKPVLYRYAKPDTVITVDSRPKSGGAWERVFSGWLNEYVPEFDKGLPYSAAMGFLGALGRLQVTSDELYTTLTGRALTIKSGDAINAVLDAVRWPSNLRSIDEGETSLSRGGIDEEDVFGAQGRLASTMEALAQIVRAEMGIMYDNEDGRIEFESREARIGRRPTRTISDIEYARLEDPDQSLVNSIKSEQNAVSQQAGIVLFGPVTVSIPAGEEYNRYEPLWDTEGRQRHMGHVNTTSILSWEDTTTIVSGNAQDVQIGAASTTGISWSRRVVNNSERTVSVRFGTIRGTARLASFGTRILVEKQSSIDDYGRREMAYPAKLIPELPQVRQFLQAYINLHHQPQPHLVIRQNGHTHRPHMIGDIVAIRSDELALNGDYYIEYTQHTMDEAQEHHIEYGLTHASYYQFSKSTSTVVGTSRAAVRRT